MYPPGLKDLNGEVKFSLLQEGSGGPFHRR